MTPAGPAGATGQGGPVPLWEPGDAYVLAGSPAAQLAEVAAVRRGWRVEPGGALAWYRICSQVTGRWLSAGQVRAGRTSDGDLGFWWVRVGGDGQPLRDAFPVFTGCARQAVEDLERAVARHRWNRETARAERRRREAEYDPTLDWRRR